jgi:hypothetical protein
MFTKEELQGALVLEANYFSNSLIRNNGNGTFDVLPLPTAAQYACINGVLTEDFDGDGNLDVLIAGNDYGTEVSVGRYDACNGLLLKGNGKGGFTPLSILQSGWFVPQNGKAVVKFRNKEGQMLVAASQNKGPLKVFALKRQMTALPLLPTETSVLLTYKNGAKQKREAAYGASFLSQSGRFVSVGSNVTTVAITDVQGRSRTVQLK